MYLNIVVFFFADLLTSQEIVKVGGIEPPTFIPIPLTTVKAVEPKSAPGIEPPTFTPIPLTLSRCGET